MTDWAIPQQAKLKYTQLFNLHDRSRSGFLSGIQCRDILMQSGLPRNILAEIWNLSDIDGDGQLTREEFILAMHLTNQVRIGQALPQQLPADMIPPSYRRARSISTTSVHSATSANSSAGSGAINDDQLSQKSAETVAPSVGSPGSILNSNSFEDKRRENFEKGRAELERRRLKIIEQQTSVLSEQLVRCKKQVADAKSKIDSMRSERDTKAGLLTSLEAQLKTIRDRKAFLDHEEIQIIAIAKDLNLINSVHSAELDQQATKTKQDSINQMKEQLAALQSEKDGTLKKLADAQSRLDESKKELKSVTEEASKGYINYKEQIAKAKVLKQQFIDENKSKPINLDSVWDAAPSFGSTATNQSTLNKTEPVSAFPASDDPWAVVTTTPSAKQSSDETFAIKNLAPTTTESNNNFEPTRDFTSQSLSNVSPKLNEPSMFDDARNSFIGTPGIPEPTLRKKMYKAVYAFDARNPDELTINPGDIIIGSEEVCEPGWLSGEIGGRNGLFPEAYVEQLPDSEPQIAATSVFDSSAATSAPSILANIPSQSTTMASQEITQQASTTSPAVVKYKVIYAFEARGLDELTMNPGDIITGVDGAHEPGWLMGELNGQRGLFPEAYVEKLAETQAEQTTTEQTGTLRRGSSSGSLRSKKSRAKKAEVATAIANYRALGQEQLSLEKGQLVLIRRKIDSGWWEGELQIKDKKQQHDVGANIATNKPKESGKQVNDTNELDHLICELVTSEWDYVNDLRLCQSAYIFPLSNSFDVSHIFTNWNQLIQMHEYSLTKLSDACPSSNTAASTLANGNVATSAAAAAAAAVAVAVGGGGGSGGGDIEKRKLDYCFIFDTFQHLFSSIVELYVDFCSRQNEATRQLEAKITSDIRFRQLVSESQRKLRKLIEQQIDSPLRDGDPQSVERARALQNSNLPLTSFLLKPMQRITKYGLIFDRMLKIVSLADSREAREYSLQAPLKRLKMSADSLCRQVNEACRLKEDDEDNNKRLRWCQSHIKQQNQQASAPQFDGLAASRGSFQGSPVGGVDLRHALASTLPLNESFSSPSSVPMELIQFNSNTNCLGARRIIKAGSLIKLRSGRELVAFLFNDFLLLTQIKGGTSLRVSNVFKSDRAQQAYYKFYRPPILLEDIQLDNFDNELQHQMCSLSCPSINSASSANSAFSKEQEGMIVSFLDRNSGSIYNLVAMSVQEKCDWSKVLAEQSLEAYKRRTSQQSGQLTSLAVKRLSVSECLGRLFVYVLELVRITSTRNSSEQSKVVADLNSSWERRIASINQVDPIQNLCVKMQMRSYKRTQTTNVEEEKREVVPISDEFKTNSITVSELRRQPVMVDMNESMSNLDVQRDAFKFDTDSTQFLIAHSSAGKSELGSEYLDIELIDDSRFRETRLICRKRINLDQLLGRNATTLDQHSNADKDSPAKRSTVGQSGRHIQALQPNRPVDMTFKLKSVLGDQITNKLSSLSLSGRKTSMSTLDEQQKFIIKLRFHLQKFCDINSLI